MVRKILTEMKDDWTIYALSLVVQGKEKPTEQIILLAS